jgi:hypothetical protein
MKKLRQAASAATEQAGERPAWGGRDPDEDDYGKAGAATPDTDALVTDAAIEEATGASPEGRTAANGPDGTQVDLGGHLIGESKLSNDDKFLISLIAASSLFRLGRIDRRWRPAARI